MRGLWISDPSNTPIHFSGESSRVFKCIFCFVCNFTDNDNDSIYIDNDLYRNRANQLILTKKQKKQVFREIFNEKISFVPTINLVWTLLFSFGHNRHYFWYFSTVLVWCLDAFDSVVSSVNHIFYFYLLLLSICIL